MKLINRIIFIALIVNLILPTYAYSFTDTGYKPEIRVIQQEIKREYGINIVLPNEDEDFVNIEKCLAIIEKGLSRFPKGLLKEITNIYLKDKIETNIIINMAEQNSFEIPAEYRMEDKSADITIYLMSNNYYDSCEVVSLDGIIHELGHFICDYLFNYYGYESLSKEFGKLSAGYEYGNWGEGYDKVFVNRNSANNLANDITDLIWVAESHPEKLRKLSKKEIIHNKIEFLADLFDKSFESINEETKLWHDAIPDSPDLWALDTIEYMENKGLIPEEFEGKYDSYITREDFYILSLNLIKTKLGEEEFYNYFNISENKKGLNIDPVNGHIIVDDEIFDEYYSINLCDNKKDIYEAYKIGLINDLNESRFNPEENITRLEAIKLSAYICEKFGINIVDYEEVNFTDSTLLNDYEKLFVYFAVNNGIILGDGNKLMPYKYCTYQEAFILMERVYELIN